MIKIPIGFLGLLSVFCAFLPILSKDLYFRIKIGKGYLGGTSFIEETSEVIKTSFFYLSLVGWTIVWFGTFHLIFSFMLRDLVSYIADYISSLSIMISLYLAFFTSFKIEKYVRSFDREERRNRELQESAVNTRA